MKINRRKLSAIVITLNEEERIGDCLKSVSFANEVIVVDSGSVDKTVDIAEKFGAKIVEQTAGNFSQLRNKGVKEAKSEWLLYVDADERVTPALRREIGQLISKSINRYSAYAIPRRNFILGKELKHGGWWPDYVLRLIKKSALKGWKGELHEQPEIKGLPAARLPDGQGRQGDVGKLKNPLIHLKHDNLNDMVDKTNEWSEIEAKLMYKAKHPPMNILRFATAMFREFWLRMIKQRAFMDGSTGIIYALYQVFSRFVSYAKLWEMQLNSSKLKVQSSK